MTNIVHVLTNEQIELLKVKYSAFQVVRKAPGVVFAAKLPDTSITIYKSNKVMFQGAGAAREAAQYAEATASKPKVTNTKGDKLPENFDRMSVIGSDETGTGDYFGPVTVCAVYVPAHKIELIKELGAKDSKQINDTIVREIAPLIMQSCTYSLLTLRNPRYNEIQAKGYSQGKIKALLHNQALAKVLEKIAPEKPDYILIDQFAERGIYYNHIKSQKHIVSENVLFSTKAEQLHIAVAAASIIARYAFLLEIDKISEQFGMPIQKGAGPKVDEQAARIIKKHGKEVLQAVTKWHFANTSKAFAKLKK